MSVPFLGEFKMATESTGAESGTDYSGAYVSGSVSPEAEQIVCGPYLADNFEGAEPGHFRAPISLTLEGLTQVQIKALHANFKARDLMEFKFMSTAGTIDTPTTSNMQWTVQFYLPSPPPLPMVVGEKARWEFTVNATFAQLDDSSSATEYGTAA